MKIAISLLTHNDLPYLKPCIESLLNSDLLQHTVKLFAWDNNSNDALQHFLSGINVNKQLHFNSSNEGIVIPRIKIFNEIIKEDFDFLLEIHSDMLFPKIWLSPLLAIDDEQTGILEPHIYLPGKRITIDILEEKIQQLKYSGIYNKCRQVHPWLIKLQHIGAVGGYYDENFSPQQCEDDDFIYRMMLNGFKIKSTGKSWVCHYGGVTRGKALPSFTAEHKKYFISKHGIDFDSFVDMFEYHPYKNEVKKSFFSKFKKAVWPLVLAMLVALVIVALFPSLSLFIPKFFGLM